MGRAGRLTVSVLLVGVVAAGCGDTDQAAGPGAAGELAGGAEVVATSLTVTATDHHFSMSADTVSEGTVPIELVNEGASPHHLLVVRLDEGQTIDDYLAAFEGGETSAND